jgi:hypothetical protein
MIESLGPSLILAQSNFHDPFSQDIRISSSSLRLNLPARERGFVERLLLIQRRIAILTEQVNSPHPPTWLSCMETELVSLKSSLRPINPSSPGVIDFRRKVEEGLILFNALLVQKKGNAPQTIDRTIYDSCK